jgi:predicted transcriptional regulator
VGGPWHEIVDAGYVTEAPQGGGKYEITDKGWAVVKSNTVEVDDDYISTILP